MPHSLKVSQTSHLKSEISKSRYSARGEGENLYALSIYSRQSLCSFPFLLVSIVIINLTLPPVDFKAHRGSGKHCRSPGTAVWCEPFTRGCGQCCSGPFQGRGSSCTGIYIDIYICVCVCLCMYVCMCVHY